MGVLGLTPFLQKTCPEVIKHLPDRLRGLAGKTIVIDGTLITQRLHFAPIPNQYRHVLGWYRILKELQDCNVSAICVFDGKERSLAKAREAERRKEMRRLTIARGAIEVDRVQRLRKLVRVLNQFRCLDSVEKVRVTEPLRHFTEESEDLPTVLGRGPEFASAAVSNEPCTALGAFSPAGVHSPTVDPPTAETTPSLAHDVHLPPALQTEASSVSQSLLPPISPSESSSSRDDTLDNLAASFFLDELTPSTPVQDSPFPVPQFEPEADFASPVPVEDITTTLSSLYLDYRKSIPKLVSLTPPPSTPPLDHLEALTATVVQEVGAEYSMSKSQYKLTLEEGKIWEELVSPTTSPLSANEELDSPSSEETLAATLSMKAEIMSDSFQRRANPPTNHTYDECKEVLRAMGVPCIDTTGTFEAEALASALVIHGHADYVASEDTDVLVYEAPLIRNITNRQGPLIVLSGEEIRTVLQLDRSSYIDFALLLGTDFSQRIKNVGPHRALKLIRQHKSIEQVIEHEKKYTPRVSTQAYLAQVEIARMVFQNLPPVPEKHVLMQKTRDEEGLSVLLQRFGLGKLLMEETAWDHAATLEGNYYEDDPTAF